jgi:hypothetical protein
MKRKFKQTTPKHLGHVICVLNRQGLHPSMALIHFLISDRMKIDSCNRLSPPIDFEAISALYRAYRAKPLLVRVLIRYRAFKAFQLRQMKVRYAN